MDVPNAVRKLRAVAMTSKYERLADGAGVEVTHGKMFKLACCDCGLVHKVVIVADGKKIGVALARDKRATAAMRRGRKFPDKT